MFVRWTEWITLLNVPKLPTKRRRWDTCSITQLSKINQLTLILQRLLVKSEARVANWEHSADYNQMNTSREEWTDDNFCGSAIYRECEKQISKIASA